MSRKSIVLYLSPEDHAKVDACVRRHRFVDYSGMQAELLAAGIKVSRSALHRYAGALRAEGPGRLSDADDATLVVVVDLETRVTTTVTTPISAEAVLALIHRPEGQR
ncbi:MAG: DUF3486 family protein [Rubrivivax sp.]